MEEIGPFKFVVSAAEADSQDPTRRGGCDFDPADAFSCDSVYGPQNLELFPFPVDNHLAEKRFVAIELFADETIRTGQIIQ